MFASPDKGKLNPDFLTLWLCSTRRVANAGCLSTYAIYFGASVDAAVKIIDFGLSKKYAAGSYLHETVGTV